MIWNLHSQKDGIFTMVSCNKKIPFNSLSPEWSFLNHLFVAACSIERKSFQKGTSNQSSLINDKVIHMTLITNNCNNINMHCLICLLTYENEQPLLSMSHCASCSASWLFLSYWLIYRNRRASLKIMALSALGSWASNVIAAALSLIMDPNERRDENSFPYIML